MFEHLTEKNLGLILTELFPNNDFIHNKGVPEANNTRTRPDYRSKERKLIIEFDGDTHYCKSNVIKSDFKKDIDYASIGYRIFRIPYFVQITTKMLKDIFDENIKWNQRFTHGFISPKVTLPADYCDLGIKRFKNDLDRFDYHAEDIVHSLKNKLKEKNDMELILPDSLLYLIK